MNNKIKIHLVLPGGGARGSFQGGFLYVLAKHFNECFDFVQVDSASVGALNGTGLCLEMYEDLKQLWLNFNSINDIFSPYSSIPLIGPIVNAYSSYYKMGLNTNIKLENIINKFFDKSESKKKMSKLNIVVTNLSSSRYEYVNGTNKDIKEYLKASSSPWIITQPTIINNVAYTDGSLLQQFPIKNIDNVDSDYVLIVGIDSEYFKYMYSELGSNLFGYINKVLDVLYLQCNLDSYVKIMEMNEREDDIFVFKYNLNFSPMDFSQKNINEGLEQGRCSALKFILNNVDLKKYYKPSEYLNIDI
jgi:predicted acylesterase/phospholipase RssA